MTAESRERIDAMVEACKSCWQFKMHVLCGSYGVSYYENVAYDRLRVRKVGARTRKCKVPTGLFFTVEGIDAEYKNLRAALLAMDDIAGEGL